MANSPDLARLLAKFEGVPNAELTLHPGKPLQPEWSKGGKGGRALLFCSYLVFVPDCDHGGVNGGLSQCFSCCPGTRNSFLI